MKELFYASTYLISQSEPTHLRVVLELLDTDSARAAGHFHAGDDAVALLRVRGRHLALSARLRLQLV